MSKASTDETYCVNDKCEKICNRHVSNYEFEKDKDYWFQKYCTDFLQSQANIKNKKKGELT